MLKPLDELLDIRMSSLFPLGGDDFGCGDNNNNNDTDDLQYDNETGQYYRIVAADSRMPRDGRFIEKLGTYNPLLPKDSEDRVKMDVEKVQEWIAKGAQPTERVVRMLEAAGIREKTERNNPKKGAPGKKAQERAQEKADKAAAAAEAANAPAEEASAE